MTDNSATNLQNRVTGGKWVIILVMLFVLEISERSYGWEFISKTPEIRGKIVNATTGDPIEKAIVTCSWWKNAPFIVDSRDKVFYFYEAVTDSTGGYRIPKKASWHFPPLLMVGSSFAGTWISVYHPLYETKRFMAGGKSISEDVSLEELEEIRREGKTNIVGEGQVMGRIKEERIIGTSKKIPNDLPAGQTWRYRGKGVIGSDPEGYYEIVEVTIESTNSLRISVGPSSDGVVHYDIRLMGLGDAKS